MKPDDLKTFLAVVPIAVEERLREEAKREGRTRQAQLVRVLQERYGLAPEPERVEAAA